MRIDTTRDYSPIHPQEVYRYPGLAIDVCKAWRIIAALTNAQRQERAGTIKIPKSLLDMHWVDPRKAMDADLTVPVLVGQWINCRPSGNTLGTQVIDGWHRCYKAVQLRKRTVSAFKLTVEEAAACTLGNGSDWMIAKAE